MASMSRRGSQSVRAVLSRYEHARLCCRSAPTGRHWLRVYLGVMTLDLSDDEAAALTRLLTNTIDADHYPLSPRIQTLKAILGKIRPEPGPRALAAAEAV